MPPTFAHGAGMHQRSTWRLAVIALLLSGAVFACVVSDALTGPKSADVVLHFTGDSILVVGDTVAFGFVAVGQPGAIGAIEVSPDLRSWDLLMNFTISLDGTCEITDPAAQNHPQRFYRVVSF